MQLFLNNYTTTLTADVDAADSQLSIPGEDAERLIGLGEGGYYCLTYAERDSSGKETAWEIIRVTGRDGGVLDVQRGQEGTAALDMPAGAELQMRLTAETLMAVQAQSNQMAAALVDMQAQLDDLQGRVEELENPDDPGSFASGVITVGLSGGGSAYGYWPLHGVGGIDPATINVPGVGLVQVGQMVVRDNNSWQTLEVYFESEIDFERIASITLPFFGTLQPAEDDYWADSGETAFMWYIEASASDVRQIWYEGAELDFTIRFADPQG